MIPSFMRRLERECLLHHGLYPSRSRQPQQLGIRPADSFHASFFLANDFESPKAERVQSLDLTLPVVMVMYRAVHHK